MTYPDDDVRRFLEAHFEPYKLNVKETGNSDHGLLVEHRLLWEPGFVYLDPREKLLHRNVGFLPPARFIAQGFVALGKGHMLYRRFEDAETAFVSATERDDSEIAAEAHYWRAIAAYRLADNDKEVLRDEWRVLKDEFPATSWCSKADVF